MKFPTTFFITNLFIFRLFACFLEKKYYGFASNLKKKNVHRRVL